MRRAFLAFTAHWQLLPWPSTVPPKVDGRLDEALWQNIPAYEEFYQVLPQAGQSAPFKTSIRLAWDAQNLYIGAHLQDPAEGERHSNVSRRDHIPGTDDTLTIIIDPLGTRAFGQMFVVNPDCSISDGLYKEASLSTDLSSDFQFEVACQQDDHGWSVEYKIPLTELRFVQDNDTPWNILVQRSVVRDQLRTTANAPLPRDPLCLLCLAPALEGTSKLPDPSFIRLAPYIMSRYNNPDPGPASSKFQAGLDLKYRINSASIIDATVNPDFSQVDLDEPQLSANAQFAVSSPENRPFFLEGADILETPLKAVATRAIKQPSWGLKFTRRTPTNDTMILTGDDRTNNAVLLAGGYGSRVRPLNARQNYAIGSSHWKGERYNLGMTVTARNYEDLGSNQTLSLDGLHYLTEADSLRWQSILSLADNRWDPELQNFRPAAQQNGSAQYLLAQHKGEVWRGSFELKSFSDDFRTDLGFNPRNAYRLAILTNGYNQTLADQHLELYLRQTQKEDLAGRVMQKQSAPGLTLTGFLGANWNFETRPMTRERVRSDGGLHRFQQHSASISLSPGSILTYWQCDITWGERVDVASDRVRPGRSDSCTLRLALGKQVELSSSVSEEILPDVLLNQAMSHLLVIPFSPVLSMRYIRQEELIKRPGSTKEYNQTDSWNVTYDDPTRLTLHAGTTIARSFGLSAQIQREYYLKLSRSMP